MSSNATACSMLVRHACYACSGQHGILSWASSPGCAAFWQIEHCGRQVHRCSTWLQILF